MIALSIMLPQGAAFAEDVQTGTHSTDVISIRVDSATIRATDASAPVEALSDEIATPAADTADPSQAKITKEQAVGKVKELFPQLEQAEVSRVELGNSGVYPPSANQMIWNIHWSYETGNSSYGFSSEVDALTGDLISTFLGFPQEKNTSYYPPKLTREQALAKARAFIVKAAPTLSARDVSETQAGWGYGSNRTLFGPVQYEFSFEVLKNGLPSDFDSIHVTVDGDGNVTGFSRPSDLLEYPSAAANLTQEEAEKKSREEFKVGLGYVPTYKDGSVSGWVLAWGPSNNSVLLIDAETGHKINYEGVEVTSTSATYQDVPQTKEMFQPRNSGVELTAEEAAKLVEQIAYIPEGRTLTSHHLGPDFRDSERKIWQLNWGKSGRAGISG
ncbi:YcdB/YcdC domain-containing protein [Paenibacillus macerans]|uniref:YcdB/YcdC domain-containing protein n=1 Tax=Paenibacillus macerans TaxID=44252 RepID=UPI00203ECAD3|nr:YcdB/YcdC domain-containing protein [Paenibacillus macerans]MCM3700503.1 hypothetical protein [Paenibacillus macerans]